MRPNSEGLVSAGILLGLIRCGISISMYGARSIDFDFIMSFYHHEYKVVALLEANHKQAQVVFTSCYDFRCTMYVVAYDMPREGRKKRILEIKNILLY